MHELRGALTQARGLDETKVDRLILALDSAFPDEPFKPLSFPRSQNCRILTTAMSSQPHFNKNATY